MTNTPPNGAFRGFGAPQTQFAVEAHLDRIAEAVGLDPVRIRERNALRPGDTTATGQRLGADTSALPVLREAVRRSRFREKRRAWRGHRARHRAVAGLPRLGVHRRRRNHARLRSGPRADRDRRPHPGGEHRDRPGHADHARADRRRRARRALRGGRGPRRRHRRGARQRPDGGVAHLHDRRRAARARRAGGCASGSAR